MVNNYIYILHHSVIVKFEDRAYPNNKVYAKLIEGHSVFGPTMSPDGAQLFIQEAIPALLEKENS